MTCRISFHCMRLIFVSALAQIHCHRADRVLARSQSATAISITCVILISIFCKTVKKCNWMDILIIFNKFKMATFDGVNIRKLIKG
jgi:hypothetical protein